VDFTDLNKPCPKYSYPLPRIDQLVNSTPGHKLLSFMDAFLGYNQIRMVESLWQLETQPVGNWDLIGKDPTGSLIAKGRGHTWKP